MRGTLLLATRSVMGSRGQSSIVVACLALALWLPTALHVMVDRFERELLSRARSTPLIIGARGSRFDLAFHAMYFTTSPPADLRWQELQELEKTRRGRAIPMLIRDRAAGYPVVGTTLDYFQYRDIRLADGRPLIRIGDCVLGSRVAAELKLAPDDRLLTDPRNPFDLAGEYPLKMRVTGVLAPSGTADDNAVFVDIKTAWIITGIGHGHRPADSITGPDLALERSEDEVIATDAVEKFTEVTDANVASFHFHGDRATYPLSAILAVPHDTRSETLLLGRYVDPEIPAQALLPVEVVDELLQRILKIRRFFDLLAAGLAVVTLSFLGLISSLSARLRQDEMQTMHHLGCSRFMILRLQLTELAILLVAASVVTVGLVAATLIWEPEWIAWYRG